MQAGRHWRFRRVTTRSIGASGRRFPPFFDGGCEHSRAATHVDACDGVFSDAGSTPAASTTRFARIFSKKIRAFAFKGLLDATEMYGERSKSADSGTQSWFRRVVP